MEGSQSIKRSPCLVTVHGIGFQQPPTKDPPRQGYADPLHTHLHAYLDERHPGLLGDDPNRPDTKGPVYVSSAVDGNREAGLRRLKDPLVGDEGRQIAHVAVVYTPSESPVPDPGAVAETLARALLGHGRYVGALGALRLALRDTWAALHERRAVTGSSTLQPRQDLPLAPHHRRVLQMLLGRGAKPPATPGVGGIVQALEDDIATYVTRNDLRERVRGFVQEVLLALLDREDVSCLVVNAHSQGTVLSWDVLCRIPASTWLGTDREPEHGVLGSFVTAGSPIRKYVDIFDWGNQVGELSGLTAPGGPGLSWQNFWDPFDPVADPLNPNPDWQPGKDPDKHPPSEDGGLLIARDPDSAKARHVTVTDTKVNNIEHSSGGGLQAHDYWNNTTDFVPKLATLLATASHTTDPGRE
jgi:hypothetical protein